ncbi:MAG TPA: lamin tail domain-containing protein, partial [Candidatus Limnocylindrales bacterium]
MDRARRAGFTALIVVALLAAIGGSDGSRALAGAVSWPPSTLVVSEVETGGASASDEFVEVANQGSGPVELQGLEVVYATSSGSTITRKGTWSVSTVLDPGRRILLANASGTYASIADLTYSGGFAATGGAIALRLVGGAAIDAVGWGDATNAFVEGLVAAAPPAGSSLERAPGGSAGNGRDTNDNASDWFVQGAPSPQNLSAPAVPAPGTPSPTPVPTATPAATPTPTPAPTPAPTPVATPTATATATPTPAPTATPAVTPTPAPSSTPTPTPTPQPTPTPTPEPTPTPTPEPTPTPAPLTSIADARGLPDGATATIQGILTTALGALESGRTGFVQDASGGIALYLDAPVVGFWPAGTTVTVQGSISSRFSQRTLRIAESSIVVGSVEKLPASIRIGTGEAAEAFEGERVVTTGTVSGSPDVLADGFGITLDDGSGPVRGVIGADALAGRTIASGMTATVSGPLGQRDSSGTGTAGYRIQATLAGELELVEATPPPTPTAPPTPDPTATPAPTPTPTPAATATPTPAPTTTPPPDPTATPVPTVTATPVPTPTPTSLSLAAIRSQPIGSRVATSGVVVAEAGRLGTPPLLAIGDERAGLVVRLPDGAPAFARGARIEVTGKLAAPYGQLEIRPATTDIRAVGSGVSPTPIAIGTAGLGESFEGRLVTTTGRLTAKPTKTSSGDITLILERDGASPVKVMADASSRIASASLKVGSTYRVVGFVGQRASRSGALDGYRIWARDGADLVVVAGASPSATRSATPGPGSSPAGTPDTVTIARGLRITDRAIAIDAIVTAPATLLDATGRRIVVQDASGAIELLLPTGTAAPPVGARIHAIGRIGVAYGAPRLRADRLDVTEGGPVPAALVLH